MSPIRRRAASFGLIVALTAACADEAPEPGRTAAPAAETAQDVLDSVVAEFASDAPFGALFARRDTSGTTVYVSGAIRPDDHLRLGSVSKLFLSYLFLRQGSALDDPIDSHYDPRHYPAADLITPRLLLNHSSGVPDEMVRRTRDLEPRRVLQLLQDVLSRPAGDPDERIRGIYNHEVGIDFPPGSRWCYSNTGYMMLARILERSTGHPVEALVAEHFAAVAPGLYLDDGSPATFPTAYPEPWPIHSSHPWIAGGIIAPAADALAAFDHLARQPEFAAMQEWTEAPRCPTDVVFGDDYGLGLQRYTLGGPQDALGHDGHIFARSLLVTRGENTYLLHLTAPLENADVRAIATRLLATQR